MSRATFVTNTIPSNIESLLHFLNNHKYQIVILFNKSLHQHLEKFNVKHEWNESPNLHFELERLKSNQNIVISDDIVELTQENIERVSFLR